MAYAIHRHPHRHITVREHRHPKADNGWWKFALSAAIMTAVAVAVVTSPVLRKPAPTSAPTIKFLTPSITRLSVPELDGEPQSAVVDLAVAAPVDSQAQASIAPVASSKSASASVASAPAAVQPQVAASIHDVNFATLPSLQSLANQWNGSVDPATIKYADLTGDGADEAIVPVSSGGTAGNLGYVVYTERAGSPVAILTRQVDSQRRSLVPIIESGSKLTETAATYGPNDANCCPSQLVKTYFRWDGTYLVPDRTSTMNIPQGKLAD